MTVNNSIDQCPRTDISAYVDKELSDESVARLETHLTGCKICREAVQDQKKMLAALASSLASDKFLELPPDFTKRVVSTAESSVLGLRRSNEIVTAASIATALFLFVLFAFQKEAMDILLITGSVGGKLFAVVGFVLGMAANLTFAAGVVVRSLVSHESVSAFVVPLSAVVLGLITFVTSRRMLARRNA